MANRVSQLPREFDRPVSCILYSWLTQNAGRPSQISMRYFYLNKTLQQDEFETV